MAIHRTAWVDTAAKLHETVEVGPNVVIDGPVRIGANSRLGPSVVVLGETEIGEGCLIHSHAVIGDEPQDQKFRPGSTRCSVGNHCVIREGVTIHRASIAGGATFVGDHCYLMTNSHVAHDCVLEEGVTLVSGALLGGHVHVGKRAIIAGNSGVHQHVRIGELAMIAAVTMISQDVAPFTLTNHAGEIVGLNTVGLMRAGFTPAERLELKSLFKLIYRSDMPRAQAIEIATELATFDAANRFVDFFTADSHRGIRRLRVVGSQAA
ncbi:acyl-ACP--UDP-N-acetylglucosamine O-acyltransferase [Pirellulaceae bacterium SH501]